MTIKILEKIPGSMPHIIAKGDWIDLYTTEDIQLNAPKAHKLHKRKQESHTEITRDVVFDSKLSSLGVAMQLPMGFEAWIAPRSSTFKKFGLIQTNSPGIIDNSYNGNNDVWHMSVVATRKVMIPKGTRIAQFRIQLSQKATIWQKLRWLFSSGIKLQKVNSLGNENRGGFGSTGV